MGEIMLEFNHRFKKALRLSSLRKKSGPFGADGDVAHLNLLIFLG
jgi:hypothetical protein